MASKSDQPPEPVNVAGLLAGVLRDVVASGRKALETPGLSDADAVHDLRKALKCWRAMLRLIGPVVGPEEAERMRLLARDLARGIAAARDGRAAQEAFEDLSEEPAQLPKHALERIGGELDKLRSHAEAGNFTDTHRAGLSRMWAAAAAAIDRWPIGRFDIDAAARQLTTSYRRARAAIPTDWALASDDALHRLRRRLVEHRYQMDLTAPLWPRVIRAVVSEAQRLRDRLGAHQDLVVLQGLTEPGGPLAPWRAELAPLIKERQTAHVAAARRLAGRLFAERPKAFRERMTRLMQHHFAVSCPAKPPQERRPG